MLIRFLSIYNIWQKNTLLFSFAPTYFFLVLWLALSVCCGLDVCSALYFFHRPFLDFILLLVLLLSFRFHLLKIEMPTPFGFRG